VYLPWKVEDPPWQTSLGSEVRAERPDALLTQTGVFPRPSAIRLKADKELATGLVYILELLHFMCKFQDLLCSTWWSAFSQQGMTESMLSF